MKLGFTSLGCSENQNEVSLESNFHRVQIANKILALKGGKKKNEKEKKGLLPSVVQEGCLVWGISVFFLLLQHWGIRTAGRAAACRRWLCWPL